MTSFVREVLSASGALTPKEDFGATIQRLQRRADELKSGLRVEIASHYESDFVGSFNEIQEAVRKLEESKTEMETLRSALHSTVQPGLESALGEQEILLEKLNGLSDTIRIANVIKEGWTLMEKANECVSQNQLLEASDTFSRLHILLEDSTKDDVDEDQLKAFSAIKREFISSLHTLNDNLINSWDERVNIVEEYDGDEKRVIFTFNSDGFESVVLAMHKADLLSYRHAKFAHKFLNSVFKPIYDIQNIRTTKIQMKGAHSIQINFLNVPRESPYSHVEDPDFSSILEMFENLKVVFFRLTTSPIHIDSETTFVSLTGELIKEEFVQSIINDCLSISVPDSFANLDKYKDIVGDLVHRFEDTLMEFGFLRSGDHGLLNYVHDVETVFMNKKISKYLFDAREIIKHNLYETVEVSYEASDGKKAVEKLLSFTGSDGFPADDIELLLPNKDDFKSNLFSFPKCLISKSVIGLKNIIYNVLDEALACKDKPLLSARLVQGSRYIFEIYTRILSVVHEEDLKKLPQVSAIAHNNCFYLAHECLFIGIHYKSKSLNFNGVSNDPETINNQIFTFLDYLPCLRDLGEKILKNQIELQRGILLEHISGIDINSSNTEIPFRRVSHCLCHLSKVWKKVMPDNVYLKVMGTLTNSVVESLVKSVVDLENINEDSAMQSYTAFSEFTQSVSELFDESSPSRYIRYWGRFKELIFVLKASLREIEDRWIKEKSPLAIEFSVDEIKRLIRALFRNTERRTAVLTRIRYQT